MGFEEEEDNQRTAPAADSILDKKPLRIFGHPLTTTQQMWLGFMVPTSISTIIFLANFALDIAVAFQLLRDGHPLLACVTVILVYAPAVTCLVLTLMCRPKLRATDLVIWMLIQLLQTLMFPVGIMHRFASRLFWSTVALTEEDPSREEALQNAATSHQTELFFFLDSFLNAGPQAVVQAYILLSPQIFTTDETAWTQAACFATSVITLSKTAALYQRFESQREVGRSVPWDSKHNEAHSRALVQLTKFDPIFLMGLQNSMLLKKPQVESINVRKAQIENQETSAPLHEENQTFQRPEPGHMQPKPQVGEIDEQEISTALQSCDVKHERQKGIYAKDKSNNTNESAEDKTQNEPKEHDALLLDASMSESHENNIQDTTHNLEPIRIESVPLEDRCFWPRVDTPPTTPTADPHMRPRLSINTIRSQNRPAYTSQVRFPIRKPRTKGLHEDEPLGVLTIFNAWVTYLTARILILAAFSNFYLWASLGLILCHYSIMVSYLCFSSSCRNLWIPLLGLMFILFPVEVNVRYKYPRIFLVVYFALVFLEDLCTSILWYYGTVWNNWWYDFTFYFIFACHGAAALNAIFYLFMCRPKAKYIEDLSS